MKENASLATRQPEGGGRLVLDGLTEWLAKNPGAEVHIACHSAGSIFMAPVVKQLADRGIDIASLSMWAPACTMELFHAAYLPSIRNGKIQRFSLFTLKDGAERDDHCANIYHKSLLYLVSNALEKDHGLLWKDGVPLLGMEKFILRDKAFNTPPEKEVKRDNPHVVPLFNLDAAQWIRCPNGLSKGNADASHARHHGAFDDDPPTVEATLARLMGLKQSPAAMDFGSSKSSRSDCRRMIEKRVYD